MGQVCLWLWLAVSAACMSPAWSLWCRCGSAKIRVLPQPRLSQVPSDKCSFFPQIPAVEERGRVEDQLFPLSTPTGKQERSFYPSFL